MDVLCQVTAVCIEGAVEMVGQLTRGSEDSENLDLGPWQGLAPLAGTRVHEVQQMPRSVSMGACTRTYALGEAGTISRPLSAL